MMAINIQARVPESPVFAHSSGWLTLIPYPGELIPNPNHLVYLVVHLRILLIMGVF